MSDTSGPTITGIHHFSPTVRDVEASAAWYEQVFSMFRVPVTFAHHEREETGYAVMLILFVLLPYGIATPIANAISRKKAARPAA